MPIILIPGVMGSRIHCGESKTWDPDKPIRFAATWVPYNKSKAQKNRAALAVSPSNQPSFVTELVSDAMDAIASSSLGSTRGATLDPMSGDWADFGDIQPFYGKGRNWSSVAWSFYGSALLTLEIEFLSGPTKCPVFAFGYDWRMSNADSAKAFAQFMQETVLGQTKGAERCIVVTHSMGGFVLRGALTVDPNLKSKILGVIHAAHPSLGAVACYTRFFTGVSNPVEDLGILDVPARLLARVLGSTAPAYAYNMSGLPGPLQLLPNQDYQKYFGQFGNSGAWLEGLEDGADLHTIYNRYSSDTAPGGLVPSVMTAASSCATTAEKDSLVSQFLDNLSLANTFHQNLSADSTAGYHANTAIVYSGTLPTLYSARANPNVGQAMIGPPGVWAQPESLSDGGVTYRNNLENTAYTRRPKGDGTVPDVSAACQAAPNDAPRDQIGGIEHSKVLANDDFLKCVLFRVKALLAPLGCEAASG